MACNETQYLSTFVTHFDFRLGMFREPSWLKLSFVFFIKYLIREFLSRYAPIFLGCFIKLNSIIKGILGSEDSSDSINYPWCGVDKINSRFFLVWVSQEKWNSILNENLVNQNDNMSLWIRVKRDEVDRMLMTLNH